MFVVVLVLLGGVLGLVWHGLGWAKTSKDRAHQIEELEDIARRPVGVPHGFSERSERERWDALLSELAPACLAWDGSGEAIATAEATDDVDARPRRHRGWVQLRQALHLLAEVSAQTREWCLDAEGAATDQGPESNGIRDICDSTREAFADSLARRWAEPSSRDLVDAQRGQLGWLSPHQRSALLQALGSRVEAGDVTALGAELDADHAAKLLKRLLAKAPSACSPAVLDTLLTARGEAIVEPLAHALEVYGQSTNLDRLKQMAKSDALPRTLRKRYAKAADAIEERLGLGAGSLGLWDPTPGQPNDPGGLSVATTPDIGGVAIFSEASPDVLSVEIESPSTATEPA